MPGGELSLEDAEKQLIVKALNASTGNRTQAAKELGISRRTLHRKLNEYGLAMTEEEDDHPDAEGSWIFDVSASITLPRASPVVQP